jgi:uncharacterized membrane protein
MPDDFDLELKPIESGAPKGNEPPPLSASNPSDAPPDGPVATTPPSLPPGFTPPVVIIEGPDPEPPELPDPTQADIEKHKGISIVGYIPPLFIVPLLIAPASRFARYHANQGLLLFILGTAFLFASANLMLLNGTLFSLMAAIGMGVLAWMGACVTYFASVFLIILIIALSISGIVHAANGEIKPLPFIGRVQLLKP